MKLPKLLHSACCLLALLIATDSKAALIYWDGDTSTTWSTGANWVGDTAPANNTNADQAGFDFAVLPTFQPNTGNRQINGLVIGDGTTAVPDFTISGTTLTIGNAGIVKNAASLNTTITPNITIEGDQSWTNNSSGTLLISGRIANGGHNLTFNGTGFSQATDRISGSGDLVKAGSGTLLLEGNSTYTGTTFIAGGTVSISAVENLGQRATARVLAFDNGGTLQATADLSFNTRLFQLGAPDAGGIAGTFEVDDSTTTQLKGAVSGAAGTGALQKTGGGILSLEATNSYTGGTIISAGTLRAGLGNNKATLGAETGAVTFNGTGATLQLTGNISDSSRGYVLNDTGTLDTNGFDLVINGGVTGDGGLVKTGTGNLTMNSTTSHGGGTTIRSGTLTVSASGSLTDPGGDLLVGDMAGDNGVLLVSGGSIENNWSVLGNDVGSTGTANMTGGTWTTNGNFYVGYLGSGSLALSGGNVTVNFYQFQVGNEGDGTLQITGGNLSTANSYLGVEVGSSGNATLTGGTWVNSNNLIIGSNGSATLAISGNAVLEVGGTLSRGAGGSIDLASGGTLQIGLGGVTGTLATNLTNNGSLIFDRTTNSVYSGSINGTGMLSKNGSGTLTLTGNNTYTGDTAINSGVLEIGAGGRLGGGSYSGNITNSGTLTHSGNDNQNLSGTISGSGGLTKSGSGSLTLSGLNSYSGNSTLNDGRINIDNNSALGSGTLIINGGSIDSTTPGITLNNNPQLWNSDFSFLGSNDLNLGNGSVSLNASRTITAVASNLTIGGSISGASLGLTKNGSGTLILSGSNSYSGDTTINSGTLSIGVSNSIAASSNLVVAGGTFDLHDFNQTLGSISGSGNITLGSGTLTSSSSSNSSFSGLISGSGGFTKSGSGSLTLSGSNSYSGNTTLNDGRINIDHNNALGSGTFIINGGSIDSTTPGITLNNNPQLWNSDFSFIGTNDLNLGNGSVTLNAYRTITTAASNLTIGGSISGASFGLTKNGSGTLILSGSNSYSGTTTITAGTIEVGAVGRLGGGSYSGNIANSGVLIYSGTNNQTLSGILSGTGALTQNAASTLTLSSVSSNYTGATTLNAGSISISNDGALGATSGVSMGNSTALLYTGAAGNLTRAISVSSGSATIQNSGSGLLTLSGGLSKNGTTLTLKGGTGGITVASAITGSAANSDLILDGGSITFSSANSYNGTTFLVNGTTLTASAANALPTTNGRSAVSMDATGAGGSTLVLGANQAIASLAGAASSNVTLGSNTLTIGTTSGNTTFAGRISGSGGLLKVGASTLVLSGANTYNGTTTINAGTLSLGAANRIASTSDLNVAGGVFNLGGYNQSLGSIAGSGNISLGSGTLTSSSSSANSSFSGLISGSGGFTKNGSGSLTLSGSNSYSGDTTINNGTLRVNGSIAHSTVTIASGATLAGSGSVGDTIISSGGRIAPGNSLGILDTGDLTLEGGGGYNWEITSVSGTPGTDWDLIRAGGGAGNATVSATPASKFTIHVLGNPAGWNPAASYLWNIMDWGAVTGFDANAFAVDTSGFTGAAPIGAWSLLNSGGFLRLGYFVGDPEWSGGSGNWSTGFFPPLTNGAAFIFTGTGGISTNDIAAATITSIGSITFHSGAGPFTLQANPGSSGYNSSSPLTLGGNVTNNSSSPQTLALALDLPGSRTFQTSPGDIVLTGPISGSGSIIKTGPGSLFVWSSVLLGGNIEVQQGLLSLNGRTTLGDLTISAGATLGGTGTIEGTVLNRGTVSPGNSIGTLTIAGDYQQASSGSLDIEIASPSSFDRLVVSGRASLAGTLQIISYGGNPLAYGQKFAFLQAGSISGSFDSINAPDGFRGRFLSSGTTGTLLIAPESYTLAATTPNQRSAAKALDSFIPATSGDRLAVSIALDELSEAEFPAAFDHIAPGFYETLADLAIEQSFVQTQLLNQRLSSVRLGIAGFQTLGMPAQPLRNDRNGSPVGDFGLRTSEPTQWSAWVLGSGSFSRSTGVSETPDSRNDAGGFLTGADYRWGGNFVTGLYAGYQYNDAKYNGGGSSRGNSALFGGYASFSRDGYYADALVGGGYTGWQTRRQIEFGTIDRTARAEPGSGQFTTALNLGKDWQLGGFTLGPILGAQFTYAGVDSFTETGADSLDLALGPQDATSLRTTLGGRVAYHWNLSQNLALVPEIRMLWLHEFLDNPRTIDASLDGGAGSAFGFDTGNPSRDSVFAGAGVGVRIGRAWTASAFYNVNFGNPEFTDNIVSLSLGVSF